MTTGQDPARAAAIGRMLAADPGNPWRLLSDPAMMQRVAADLAGDDPALGSAMVALADPRTAQVFLGGPRPDAGALGGLVDSVAGSSGLDPALVGRALTMLEVGYFGSTVAGQPAAAPIQGAPVPPVVPGPGYQTGPGYQQPAPPRGGGPNWVLIVSLVVVLALIGGLAWWWLGRSSEGATPAPATVRPSASATSGSTSTPPATTPASPPPTTAPVPSGPEPVESVSADVVSVPGTVILTWSAAVGAESYEACLDGFDCYTVATTTAEFTPGDTELHSYSVASVAGGVQAEAAQTVAAATEPVDTLASRVYGSFLKPGSCTADDSDPSLARCAIKGGAKAPAQLSIYEYSKVAGLNRGFNQLKDGYPNAATCRGASDYRWFFTKSPNKTEGQLACSQDGRKATILWSFKEEKLLMWTTTTTMTRQELFTWWTKGHATVYAS